MHHNKSLHAQCKIDWSIIRIPSMHIASLISIMTIESSNKPARRYYDHLLNAQRSTNQNIMTINPIKKRNEQGIMIINSWRTHQCSRCVTIYSIHDWALPQDSLQSIQHKTQHLSRHHDSLLITWHSDRRNTTIIRRKKYWETCLLSLAGLKIYLWLGIFYWSCIQTKLKGKKIVGRRITTDQRLTRLSFLHPATIPMLSTAILCTSWKRKDGEKSTTPPQLYNFAVLLSVSGWPQMTDWCIHSSKESAYMCVKICGQGQHNLQLAATLWQIISNATQSFEKTSPVIIYRRLVPEIARERMP